ncbi:acyl-CoA dehydrogenase family protein [Bacillus sp. Marseille-P3661]|uniref:acyl-CoA dehydrogenase family protein n=1 Tax=Bacillus sp. Marseille-P3661 TaxID=1936234 RepID=UPI0015E15CE6|nr:acyl-CoA dehydrogenase family protein [Bacillus sp. Marseille-P3661]
MTVQLNQSPLELVKQVAIDVIAPLAATIDEENRFPKEAFAAFRKNGLLGLLVPKEYGGFGGNLHDLVAVVEVIGESCGSTAMCYLMHSCATYVIASNPTTEELKDYLKAIAKGEKIGTLAFSETGTGAHFYKPEITASFHGEHLLLNGRKSFVTNGDETDFLIVITNASSEELGLDMVVVDSKSAGVRFDGSWEGIGLRGNNSIECELSGVKVPITHIVGKEGDGFGLIFSAVAPSFVLGSSGATTGLARGAYKAALNHATNRKYASGQSLADITAIQYYLAEMFGHVETASTFVHDAAKKADAGEETAMLSVMQAKIVACENANLVTNKAMQVCGGKGYSKALPVERYLRDARAGSVMAPTVEILKEWIGKSVAGIPLF